MGFTEITTISTVIIALVSVFIALWQVRSSRIHNELSVEPFISDWFFQGLASNNVYYEITNKGHGTAKIVEFTMSWNGEAMGLEELNSLFIEKLSGDLIFSLQLLGPGIALAKDERFIVFSIKVAEDSALDANKRKELLISSTQLLRENLSLTITYESLYKARYSFNSDAFLS